MQIKNEFFEGDTHTPIRVRFKDRKGVPINLSIATLIQYHFLRPDDSPLVVELTLPDEFFTDGSDGITVYRTQAADLYPAGFWKLQGYVELSDGSRWHTSPAEFYVHPNVVPTVDLGTYTGVLWNFSAQAISA